MAPTKEKVSNYIPDYIAFDILSKLPVKSLKRFSCVQKSWANLFENPQFMSMYRKNFLSKDDDHSSRLLLKQSMPVCAYDDDDNLFLLSGETFDNNVKLDWPPPFEHHRHIFIMGSPVNGILCLYQGDGHGTVHWIGHKAVLWNPCTEEFRVIPTGSFDCPLFKVVHPGSVYPPNTCLRLHGFGYDPAADDYKLVRHFCISDGDAKDDTNDETLWQIYSLRSNCWRKLHVEMPNNWWNWRSREIGHAVYLNGVCHWWGYEDFNGEALLLVSFNLSDEVFITTPLTDGGSEYDRHLVVLKGTIAMIEYGSSLGFDISILGELGVRESWTKLFSIGPLPCHEPMFGSGPLRYFREPIGVGKKGDIFFLKNRDEELVRFDLNTEMIEEIGVQGKSNCCQIVIYNESRLPIGGINS